MVGVLLYYLSVELEELLASLCFQGLFFVCNIVEDRQAVGT
jgi:hypothetical protein